MKRVVASLAVLLLVAGRLAAQGQAAAADSMTITGQVVDVSCLTLNGASGAAHKQCAQTCADKGIALGILANGTIYIPLGAGMANAQNAKLREYAEGRVRVTGMHRFSNGLHTIEVRSIAPAT